MQPIPALTSVRGIAAWMVVLFHFREALPQGTPTVLYGFAAHGYLAVDLFFQLSGFVIALNYADGFRTAVSTAQVKRFLMLRLARIYPLHLFMLLLFLLNPMAIWFFSAAGTPGPRYDPAYFLLSLLLIQNWGFSTILAWNVPAWSISTEWFAYLLFPVLAMGLGRFVRGVAGTVAWAGLLLLLLAAVAFAIGIDDLGGDIGRFGLLRCVSGFAVGMLLWRLRSLRPIRRRGEGNIASLAAAACFIIYALLPLPDYATVPLGFALLIWSLADESALVSRLLRAPLLVAVGAVSYSTYLSHYFIKDWVNFLLVRPGVPEFLPILAYLAATAVASILLYRWVEVPGREAGRALAVRGWWPPGRISRNTIR